MFGNWAPAYSQKATPVSSVTMRGASLANPDGTRPLNMSGEFDGVVVDADENEMVRIDHSNIINY